MHSTAGDDRFTVSFKRVPGDSAPRRRRDSTNQLSPALKAVLLTANCVTTAALAIAIARDADGSWASHMTIVITAQAVSLVITIALGRAIQNRQDRRFERFDERMEQVDQRIEQVGHAVAAQHVDISVKDQAAINGLVRELAEVRWVLQQLPDRVRDYGNERATDAAVSAYRDSFNDQGQQAAAHRGNVTVMRGRSHV
jgi:hypothetical protein